MDSQRRRLPTRLLRRRLILLHYTITLLLLLPSRKNLRHRLLSVRISGTLRCSSRYQLLQLQSAPLVISPLISAILRRLSLSQPNIYIWRVLRLQALTPAFAFLVFWSKAQPALPRFLILFPKLGPNPKYFPWSCYAADEHLPSKDLEISSFDNVCDFRRYSLAQRKDDDSLWPYSFFGPHKRRKEKEKDRWPFASPQILLQSLAHPPSSPLTILWCCLSVHRSWAAAAVEVAPPGGAVESEEPAGNQQARKANTPMNATTESLRIF